MEHSYLLSCESTVDMPYSYVSGRGLSILFYTYIVGDKEYVDDMERDPESLNRFFAMLDQGALPKTSQVNTFRYLEYFEKLLQQGKDILHIAFGSGMTPSVENALAAAEQLKEKYPDRKLVVLDSTCSSSGYGLIVDQAADLWDAGEALDAVANWVLENREYVHHQFFSTDMKFFRRSGRVSGVAAAAASILGICPLMRLNLAGRIIAYDKVRGKKNAIRATVETMKARAKNGTAYDGKCFISNSHCPEDAEYTKNAIEEEFPSLKGKVRIFNIGTIIGSHTGPGTVALFFMGDKRTE